MTDDNLRIVAKVEDQFTGPLGKLRKELGGVGEEAKKQGANWRKDWTGVREDMGKFQGVLKGFEPILSKIGMGGFGAALSLGGAAIALKNFSGSTRDLNLMAKQIGLTANELRTLSELGGKVGVSADTMKGAINQFAGNMVDLRQRWGQAYGELRSMNLGKLAEDLVNAPNMEAAIERAMEGLKGIPDPQKRARVSTLLFGTPDIGVVASSLNGPIREAVKRLQAELGTLDKATLEAAERFEANLNRMHNRWEKLKLKTLGPLLEGADKALDQVEKERAAAPSRLKQDEIRRQLDVLDESYARKQASGDEAGAAETKKKRDALAAEMQRLTDEIRKLREGSGNGASVNPTSFGGAGAGGGSLIQKAAWGGGSSDSLGGMRSRYPTPDFGSGSGGGGGAAEGGGSKAAPGGAGRSAALPDGGGDPAIFPKSPGGSSSGGGGAGGADDAIVNGKRYRYSSFTKAGRGRVQSWLAFMQRPTNEGGLGMPLGRARAMVAMMQGESGENLNPGAVGDHGTAFGTAQWRLERFGALRGVAGKLGVPWTDVHAQQQHFRREMLGRYRKQYDAVMGAGSDEEALYNGIAGFERPKYPKLAYKFRKVHLDRLRKYGLTGHDAEQADRSAPGGAAGAPVGDAPRGPVAIPKASVEAASADENGNFPNGAPRALKPQSMAGDPSVPGQVVGGSRKGVGDALMDRFYGKGATGGGPAMQMPGSSSGAGRGTLHIKVDGPPGTQVKHELGDLFDDTTVSKGRSQMDMDRA